MKILVFSDSHGDVDAMASILDTVPCDLVIHLGDYTRDCDDLRMLYPTHRIWQVAGNDFRDMTSGIRYEDVYDLAGVRIFATHGHRYGVRSDEDRLCAAAKVHGAALALYGHTHIAAVGEWNGVQYCNPGSANRSRSVNGRSYAMVTIENKKIHCEIVRF